MTFDIVLTEELIGAKVGAPKVESLYSFSLVQTTWQTNRNQILYGKSVCVLQLI